MFSRNKIPTFYMYTVQWVLENKYRSPLSILRTFPSTQKVSSVFLQTAPLTSLGLRESMICFLSLNMCLFDFPMSGAIQKQSFVASFDQYNVYRYPSMLLHVSTFGLCCWGAAVYLNLSMNEFTEVCFVFVFFLVFSYYE